MWENHKPLTDESVKTLAIDLHAGRVFTSLQVDQASLGMVFMPLMLGGLQNSSAEDIEKIGMLYEYLDKALPRGVNGLPCFSSMNILHRDDSVRVIAKFEEVKKALENL